MNNLKNEKTQIFHVGNGQYSQSSEDKAKKLLEYVQVIKPIDHIIVYGNSPSMSIVFKRKRFVDMSEIRKIEEFGTIEAISTLKGQIRLSVRL